MGGTIDPVLISHKHRFVFIKTRKTAGTSMEIALSRYLGPQDVITPFLPEDEDLRRNLGGKGPQNCDVPVSDLDARGWARLLTGHRPRFFNHAPARTVRRFVSPTVWDYHKVAVMRNPWDLVVSAFRWAEYRGRGYESLEAFLMSPESRRFNNWPLVTIGDEVAVDQLIRYDQLANSLIQLASVIGLPEVPYLPLAKSGYRSRVPYRDLYDNRTSAMVSEYFEREIEAMGWTFD